MKKCGGLDKSYWNELLNLSAVGRLCHCMCVCVCVKDRNDRQAELSCSLKDELPINDVSVTVI